MITDDFKIEKFALVVDKEVRIWSCYLKKKKDWL